MAKYSIIDIENFRVTVLMLKIYTKGKHFTEKKVGNTKLRLDSSGSMGGNYCFWI